MNQDFIRACINVVLKTSRPYSIKATTADIELVNQEGIWVAGDRAIVRNGLEAILNAGIDVLGLQRIQLPAEYIAATIVTAVHPVNWLIACNYLEDANITKVDALAGYAEQREPFSAKQLFSLCLLANVQDDQLEMNIRNKFRAAMELEMENGETVT